MTTKTRDPEDYLARHKSKKYLRWLMAKKSRLRLANLLRGLGHVKNRKEMREVITRIEKEKENEYGKTD